MYIYPIITDTRCAVTVEAIVSSPLCCLVTTHMLHVHTHIYTRITPAHVWSIVPAISKSVILAQSYEQHAVAKCTRTNSHSRSDPVHTLHVSIYMYSPLCTWWCSHWGGPWSPAKFIALSACLQQSGRMCFEVLAIPRNEWQLQGQGHQWTLNDYY